ncbi:phage tail family protein [Staphylococcus haemolyticus]|uniref:phage tail domain-containing protein n=1 Tax=Staphylococcus haemolyticus TaxID=1283 RepID=UPI00286372B9|nr:phage tail domain-containing protein [Staphylococcus haemolyticus]MDR5620957.1 phage tail family protein [Staphylococcus haemolyticus]
MITLTFTLYDENINEIKYPVGVTPLDILVSSIERERYEENIKGIPGPIDYGFDFKEREITLKFQMEHYHDTFDFRLQRDELYNIFSSHNHLYVSDNLVPTRVIKLQVDGQFTPERYGYWYSTLEVTGKTTGLPFWRTKYTTQDVETKGFEAIAEQFGLADGLNIDYPKYTFTENKFTVWNGGNVTLDPRNMPLKIKLKHLLTDGNFKLTNKTTGETFEYYAPRTGNTVDLDGVQAFVGYQLNRLRETNRKYISIVPGINEIEYSGGTMDDIQFDFPLYFK